MANGLVTRVHGKIAGGNGIVTRIRGFGAAGNTARVTRVRGLNKGPFAIDATGSQTVSPFDVVRMVVTILGGATADTITWTQTSGPTVTLTPEPGNPAAVTWTWRPVVPQGLGSTVFGFSVTATSGATSSTDTTTVTVLPHAGYWMYAGSVMTAIQIHPPA